MVAQLIQTLAPAPQQPQAPGQTDEQIAELRRYIESLKGERQPVQSWTQGASNLVGDVVGALGQKKIDDAQKGRQGQTDEYAAMLARGADNPGAAPTPAVPPHVAAAAVTQPPGMTGGADPVARMAAVVNTGETGRGADFGPEALGNISPDTHGSKSYGFMGLNSKTGSAGEFSKKYGPQLGITAEPGTPEFDAQWKAAAHTRPDDMRAAQMDHFKATQVDPVYQDLQRWGIPTAVAGDPRVQAYFADRHVQMGKLGLQNAAQAWQGSGGDPEKFLRNMNQIDGSPEMLQKYFPNALAQGVYSPEGHATRLNKRLSGALGLSAGDTANAELPGASTPTGGGNTSDMVRALAGQTQMAQAGPQSEGSPPSAGGNLQSEYFQHLHNFVHMGYTMPQADALATRMVEARKGFLPQYQVNDFGQIMRSSPGQPPAIIGQLPGHPGKAATVEGVPGYEHIGPDGRPSFAPINIDQGSPAAPGAAGLPPSTSPGPASAPTAPPGAMPAAGAPAGPGAPPPAGATPPAALNGGMPPLRTLQDFKDWADRNAAQKAGMVKQSETAGQLAAQGTPQAISAAAQKAAAEKTAGGMAELNLEPVKETVTHGQTAQSALNYLNLMDQIGRAPDAAHLNTGPLAHDILKAKQFFKDTFGYDMGGIVTGESIDKLNGFLASVAAKELTNRPTQFDFKTFLERNPGIEISPEGRQALIDGLRDVYRQDVQLSKLASKVKDPSDWPEIRDKYMAENPIKMTYQGKEITSAEPLPGLQGIQAPATANPSPAAVEHLRAHPELKDHFDARYGTGAADRYMKAK